MIQLPILFAAALETGAAAKTPRFWAVPVQAGMVVVKAPSKSVFWRRNRKDKIFGFHLSIFLILDHLWGGVTDSRL